MADLSTTLESVDVGWCTNITNAGPPYISEKCQTLTYLGLMRCDNVSDSLMNELVQKYPRIHYSTMYLDCQRLLERARESGHLTESETQTQEQTNN